MRGLFAGSDAIKYLTALPLTLPSPLTKGEEDAVNYFSNGPYSVKSAQRERILVARVSDASLPATE